MEEPAPADTPRQPLITLIGTGHVFDIGRRVRDEVRLRAPQVVGVELDAPRFHALRNRNKSKKGVPLAYRMLANFQARLAEEYGVEAGDEMLAAAEEARALGVPLALIDVDAQKAFQRLVKEMGFGEKVRLVGSAIAGLVLPGKSIEAQVDAMQDNYGVYFDEMGKKFPTLKRVLLDERNAHMARALSEMAKTHERLVAVVGDGHVDGMHEILAKEGLQVELVRLRQLREKAAPTGTATATLSMEVSGDAPPPRDYGS